MSQNNSSIQNIFTDAAKSLGHGSVFGNHWFSIPWPSLWWTEQNITLLELVPIVQALEAWGPVLRNQCVQLNTDNQALTHIITTQTQWRYVGSKQGGAQGSIIIFAFPR